MYVTAYAVFRSYKVSIISVFCFAYTNIGVSIETTTCISVKKSIRFFICKMARRKQRRDEVLLKKIILRVKELRGIHGHSQEKLNESTGLNIASLETGDN